MTTPPYEPMALTLALLIHAERLSQMGADFEYATYVVLERATMLAAWSEERKADLYARLVERLPNYSTSFINTQAVVTACLKEHNATWTK